MSAGVLDEIIARTRARVRQKHHELPLERFLALAPTPGARRPFRAALLEREGFNVIAEFKRRSPSRGVIRADLHPTHVAQAYEVAGAVALSVLTEEQFFGGTLDDLQQARSATLLPTLRKDFIVDPYQVWEAWIAGADAVLLIVAALSDAELHQLHASATEAGLTALVEVHDARELQRALDVGAQVIGVNNRDLQTLRVDLETSLRLAERMPSGVVKVAESGLRTAADLHRLRAAGYDAFLIGEHLMQSPDPGEALAALLRPAVPPEDART